MLVIVGLVHARMDTQRNSFTTAITIDFPINATTNLHRSVLRTQVPDPSVHVQLPDKQVAWWQSANRLDIALFDFDQQVEVASSDGLKPSLSRIRCKLVATAYSTRKGRFYLSSSPSATGRQPQAAVWQAHAEHSRWERAEP